MSRKSNAKIDSVKAKSMFENSQFAITIPNGG